MGFKRKLLICWTSVCIIICIIIFIFLESHYFFFILPYLVYYDAGLAFLCGLCGSVLTLPALRHRSPHSISLLDTLAVLMGTGGFLYLYNDAAAAYTLRRLEYYRAGSIPEEFLMAHIYGNYFNLSRDLAVFFLVFFLVAASAYIPAFIRNVKSEGKAAKTNWFNLFTACYGWVHFGLGKVFHVNFAWQGSNPLPDPLHFLLVFPTALAPILASSLGLTWYGIKPLTQKRSPDDLLNIDIQ